MDHCLHQGFPQMTVASVNARKATALVGTFYVNGQVQ
ncbi:hypothetical protein BN2476_1420002 [Paraburkholderia piptadeniae]|uniref:Uncharacterized protein n=1 Tax=Paraburkholderia piptadeniae TaxID=1701573 RepID=A0A1N7SWR0_9BURK|nr:hypothetical protein BN2476_1420002 [Paraburkholderia piptadeniae]